MPAERRGEEQREGTPHPLTQRLRTQTTGEKPRPPGPTKQAADQAEAASNPTMWPRVRHAAKADTAQTCRPSKVSNGECWDFWGQRSFVPGKAFLWVTRQAPGQSCGVFSRSAPCPLPGEHPSSPRATRAYSDPHILRQLQSEGSALPLFPI